MDDRDKLIEYLCAVQHEVCEAVLRPAPRGTWAGVTLADKVVIRVSMAAVLHELESLGARIPHVHHTVTH